MVARFRRTGPPTLPPTASHRFAGQLGAYVPSTYFTVLDTPRAAAVVVWTCD